MLNPVVSFLVGEQPFVLSQAQHSIVEGLAWWMIGLEALKQRGGVFRNGKGALRYMQG